MAMGLFSARGGIEQRIHNFLSTTMAVGMLALVVVFAISLHGDFAKVEAVLALVMTVSGILAFANRKRFLFYELTYIFLSHASILAAALAIRVS
jgi:hypothetical protein